MDTSQPGLISDGAVVESEETKTAPVSMSECIVHGILLLVTGVIHQ